MKIGTSFPRGKVARRLFGLFFLSALLPIIILAIFSFRQIDSLVVNDAQQQLRRNAKSYGLALYDRLLLLDDKLAMLAKAYTTRKSPLMDAPKTRPDIHFRSLIVVRANGYREAIHGGLVPTPTLSEPEKKALIEGKSILTFTGDELDTRDIWLLQALSETTSSLDIVAALVDKQFLWGKTDYFDQSIDLCVNYDRSTALFCSNSLIAKEVRGEAAARDGSKTASEDYYKAVWNLFLLPKFFINHFSITATIARNDAVGSLGFIKNIFAGLILLAIAVITFLSVFQIRRSLIPLEALMEGINRIAENDFAHPVKVSSDDEFGTLATSFNAMSTQISQHLDVLNAMAEIDRLILSNLKINDLLVVAITRIRGIIPCDKTSIVVLDDENTVKGLIYYESSRQSANIIHESTKISPTDLKQFDGANPLLLTEDDPRFPNYLNPLAHQGSASYLLVPIATEKKLLAILVLGYQSGHAPSADDTLRAREFGDRFAVAMANAAWEKKLYYQAHYDTLTRLPNRHLLIDRLSMAIERAARDNSRVALLFLDLDRFKSVNDSLGHSAGDELLKQMSQRIKGCLRKQDTAARQGGDEFLIILPGLKAAKEAANIAQRLLASIAKPITLDEREINLATSIGIAAFPDDGDDCETLIKNADAAMYHAKSKGRANYQYYSAELNAAALAKLEMESDIRRALACNEFELFYQPQIAIDSGRIVGAEALIRWNHPRDGLVPPVKFIPLAEENGFIVPIGSWVLEKTCWQIKQWQNSGLPLVRVSVNLASKQFSENMFVERVQQILDRANLAPEFLEMEITEGTAMEDTAKTLSVLRAFNSMGLSVSVDDFGTGYSSLSYLKNFPINTLKIDQSFVRHLVDDAADQAIIRSIITLARHLGLKVIAEGVETAAQLNFLREQGCNEYQGYIYSPPIPAGEFRQLLEKDLQASMERAISEPRGTPSSQSSVTK